MPSIFLRSLMPPQRLSLSADDSRDRDRSRRSTKQLRFAFTGSYARGAHTRKRPPPKPSAFTGGLHMTFDELDHHIGEDIIIENDDPAVIAAEVSQLLNGLKREAIFVVHRLAK